jgi:adenylate kinase
MVPRNPFITVIVTGVPGVGKTTVLGIVSKLLEERKAKYLIVNFGDYMLSEAKRLGLVSHRDEMRHLPLRKQLELQEYAARAIIRDASEKLGEDGALLVDTHAVIRTSTGFWPGLPENVVKELKPDSIIVIEAPPEIIVDRQLRDKTRVRSDLADVNLVRELLNMARVAAMSSAVLVAASVYVVENVEGKPEEAAKRIVELIEKLR